MINAKSSRGQFKLEYDAIYLFYKNVNFILIKLFNLAVVRLLLVGNSHAVFTLILSVEVLKDFLNKKINLLVVS